MHPIKRERARRRWSLRELAARSGVPAGTISGVERGQREPQILTLAKIADALEVDVEELTSSPKAPSRPSPAAPEEVLIEERREPSLIEDPRISGWVRERGAILAAMSDREFLEYGRGLDPEEIDEDGNPLAVIRAQQELAQEADATRRLLWAPKEYASLGKLLTVDPNEAKGEQRWQRREQLRKLRKEMQKRYSRRGLALVNYANALAADQEAAGKTPKYFEPAVGTRAAVARREQTRKAAHQRMLEEAFEGHEAG